MTGDSRYEEILFSSVEVKTMCDVAERLEKRGETKGIAEGRTEMLYELVESGKISVDDAAEKLDISVERLKKDMSDKGCLDSISIGIAVYKSSTLGL